jgi:UPF0716 protein FxsA
MLLIVVPASEIGILLLSGKTFGVLPTIGAIIFTGVLGAYLAKKQGIETIRKAQRDLQYGRLPSEAIMDGICILAGGVLLLAPGFITDVFGFLLLAPPTRPVFKKAFQKAFKNWIRKGNFTIIR